MPTLLITMKTFDSPYGETYKTSMTHTIDKPESPYKHSYSKQNTIRNQHQSTTKNPKSWFRHREKLTKPAWHSPRTIRKPLNTGISDNPVFKHNLEPVWKPLNYLISPYGETYKTNITHTIDKPESLTNTVIPNKTQSEKPSAINQQSPLKVDFAIGENLQNQHDTHPGINTHNENKLNTIK